ncbi:MAG: ExbD/TolR family protein [Opitutales bacterium]
MSRRLAQLAASSPEHRKTLFLLRRRRARRRSGGDDAAVDLSPLIDAVFLLLIFFLVTTMLKRLEKQIPVVLPDASATLSRVAHTDEVVFLIDSEGAVSEGIPKRGSGGEINYRPVENFDGRLKTIAEERGVEVPVRVDAQREVGFQKVIDLLDTLSIQGFEEVGVRLFHREEEYFELKDVKGGGQR